MFATVDFSWRLSRPLCPGMPYSLSLAPLEILAVGIVFFVVRSTGCHPNTFSEYLDYVSADLTNQVAYDTLSQKLSVLELGGLAQAKAASI
jgi:hypothetical protein